jgi:hypothetical protein
MANCQQQCPPFPPLVGTLAFGVTDLGMPSLFDPFSLQSFCTSSFCSPFGENFAHKKIIYNIPKDQPEVETKETVSVLSIKHF